MATLNLKDLCNYLEKYLQAPTISDFCPNGLQVEGKSAISTIGFAVSSSLATIQEAVRLGVDVLIVHHGIFWNRDSHPIVGTKKKKLELLLNHDVSLIAYHLPLDFHQEIGNNWKAALDMRWESLEPFGSYNGIPLGVKGRFPEKTFEQFKNELEQYYQHPAIVANGGKKIVSSCALVSGGAHKEILQAAACSVDCFVTGSFDEPTWHQSYEEGINFLALGHSATERIGVQALAVHLENKFNIKCFFIDLYNPF